jgi:type VI secretion system protein ImpA
VAAEAGADEAAADETATAAENGAARGGAAGALVTRDDAFRRLQEIAEFLRRTEPQSPIPCLIERAISWGQMPFERLLQEMVKDKAARGQVIDLLGITVPEQ